MADTDTEEQKRIAAEFEQQRLDRISAAQPNAIPNDVIQPQQASTVQPADPAQTAASRAGGYPQGQVISGAFGNEGPSVYALNRPKSEWGTPAAPQDSAYAQRGLPIGGESTPGASRDNPLTAHPINQEEQAAAFWAAHPNGAVKDPQTGNLIGLGSSDAYRQNALQDAGVTYTGTTTSERNPQAQAWYDQRSVFGANSAFAAPTYQKPPDFVHIPEVNPAIIAQKQNVQNEIANVQNQLRSASSQRLRGQPSQREILTQKLGTLTQANNSLGLEHYRQSEQQRKASDLNTKYQDKYLTNQDVMSANKEISQIQATHGSADYKRQYFQIVNEKYPKAMDDPIFKASAERTALSHDERSDARDRAVAAGYTVEDTGVGQKGVSQKFVAPAAVSQQQAITKATQKKIGEDFAKSGLTPEQFSQRGAVVGTDKEGKQVPNADATHMKVDIGGHHTLMPVETFNRLNGAYPSANANPAAQGQPAATPPASSIPPPEKRAIGLYDTPRGKMLWTGTGWKPQ